MILFALALAAAAHPHPPALRAPSLSHREREKAAKPPKGEGGAVDAVARRYGLAGELLVAKGDRIVLHHAYGTIAPDGDAPHEIGERWRLASVTKQVVAARVVERLSTVAALANTSIGDALDARLRSTFGFERLGDLTARQLLTHHTGMADPDDTPRDASGVPSFYLPAFSRASSRGDYCLSRGTVPGAPFRYNNCDYLPLEGILTSTEHYAGKTADWPKGMAMAKRAERGVPGFVRGAPEPSFVLAHWAFAGGLLGTARAVLDFDRSLMTGKLLPAASRDALWTPEGNGSYQALGAWVFPGKLAGCAAPKRIVQRDGEIWGVQVRNFILPDDDAVVIVFTNRSADDFAIGEVWQGKGFAYDLLSAAACA